MAVTRTTPLTTTPDARIVAATPRAADGADFEAPLHTIPYPVRETREASLDTRDLMDDEELLTL